MRLTYSAQACSAQPGSLAATATTWSLGTPVRLLPGSFPLRRFALESHRLAAPDLLEVVEVAHRGMHDVHHHVAQVHQHPLAALFAFDAVDPAAALAHALLHALGERLDLGIRRAARDHH